MGLKVKTALVTGASAGIGRCYSQALARMGVNLVVVARNESRLNDLSAQLQESFGIKVTVIVMDLSDGKAPQRIFDAIEKEQIMIDLLINNAGYGDQDEFLELDWIEHEKILQVMLQSLTQLCYLFLPSFVARGSGYIINVSSIVGLVSLSLSKRKHRMLYGPIKHYVVAFTKKLSEAYGHQGIKVQALCPGLTVSEFHQRIGESKLYTSLPKLMWMTAESVVEQSLNCLEKKKKVVVVTGVINRFFVFCSRLKALFTS